MTTLYVDVSHHDWSRRGGAPDWNQIRFATSEVMCTRATYGDPSGFHPTTYHFADFQRSAAAAGFELRGGYHNLVSGDAASMRRQVDWFRSELDGQGCHWAMLDIERYKELVENGLWPRWADVLRFRDAWHQVESRPLAYYLPRWLLSSYYGAVDLRELPGAWVQSHYLSGIYGSPAQIYSAGGGDSGTGWDDAYGNRLPDIWQYSATCTVPGASDQTDVNAFRGSLDQLRALLIGDDMQLTDVVASASTSDTPDRTVDSVLGDLWHGVHGRIQTLAADVAELKARPAAQPAPVDPAVIKAAVNEAVAARFDAFKAELVAEIRDAVADLGEGGAKQVRADQA